MTKLQRKLASAVGAAALLMNVSAPVAMASVSCTISGNGSDTSNNCDFASLSQVNVDQTNDMHVDNNVDVQSSTGKNEAKDNTGGEVEIDTGDVDTHVSVDTSGNTNVADVQGSSSQDDYNLEISGNGTDSDNSIETNVIDNVSVDQHNNAHVDNNVDVEAYTGANEAKDNTGGDVSIDTGDVTIGSGISVNTAVNANSATVGGHGSDGELSIKIKDNGSDSDNNVDLALLNETNLDQTNHADVDNNVDVMAGTGYNEAEDNTGGDTSVDTGDVNVDVTVDTMANFNTADVSDAFGFGNAELKVAGNGTESDNNIELDLIDQLDANQHNDLNVDNHDIDVYAKTGKNDVEDNTVGNGGDPMIETGDVSSDINVSTTGNANSLNGDHSVEVNFDMSEFVNLLHALLNLFN